MNRHTRSLAVLAALALVACSDDDGPLFTDAGVDAGPPPDGGMDSGPIDVGSVDTLSPTVVSTDPGDLATDVAFDADLTITFSEPMAMTGRLVALSGAEELALDAPSWDAETLTVSPTSDWPEGRVAVALLDFEDEAGNPLPTYRFSFDTSPTPPAVTSATPDEGSTVSPRTTEIQLDFDEPMDNTSGALTLDGDATVTGSRWLDADTIAFTVEGLAYEASYRATLDAFRDRRGNPLDPEPVLGDGVLDFDTGADTDGPRVTDASPAEGQLDVDPGSGTVTIVFDEPMDTSVGTATLEVGADATALDATWDGDTTLRLDVGGLLVPNQPHRVVLDGYTDVLGNALDTSFYLDDGALDFEVSRDLLPPFVGFSDPLDGSSNGSFRRDTIVVFFSEEMDPATTEVTLESDRGDFPATGTWNVGNTRLTLDVTDQLFAGETYRIDFSAFADLRGTPLDTDHPYLGDGVLEWTLADPTGESCRDALTAAQATMEDDALVWTVRNLDARLYDGSASCDPTPEGNDSVVRYTKTTDAASEGGTWLRVEVEGSEPNLEVLATTCDPTDAAAERLRCIFSEDGVGDKNRWVSFHDVGPGDYFVWFGSTDDLPESDYTVRIEEVAAPPEGETCADPWDTSSDIFTAGTGDEIGTWAIPYASVDGYDRGVSLGDDATPQCDNQVGFQPIEYPLTGADGVIQLAKASDDSVLEIEFTASGELGDSISDATAELLSTCDPLDAAAESLTCYADIAYSSSRLFRTHAEGPAGDYWLWVAADRHNWELLALDVTVSEIPATPGDSCASAIPLTEGSNAVTTPGTQRFFVPSCFDEETLTTSRPPLTWYRFSTTDQLTSFRATAALDEGEPVEVPIALVDGTTREELGCYDETPPGSTLAFWQGAGNEVCLAVESGSVTAIDVTSRGYDGVGQTVTDLAIERPLSDTGSELSWTSDYWMTLTPTTLYMGSTSSRGILQAPRGGMVRGEFLDAGLTSAELGNDGVSIGEAVFLLEDGTLDAGEPRIHRAIDSSGLLSVTAWDTGNSFPEDDANALAYDGTDLVFATQSSSSSDPDTTFYAVSPTAPDTGRLLGSNEHLDNVAGLAVDDTWIYATGNIDDDTDTDGVYRIARADLGNPATLPELIALVNVDATRAKLALHTTGTTTYVYFRDDDGQLHVADVGGAPQYLGVLSTLGRAGDEAFTYDATADAIYLFESETISNGRIVRLD